MVGPFAELAAVENPGKRELHLFVDAVFDLVHDALSTELAGRRLWRGPLSKAHSAAVRTFKRDVIPAIGRLHEAIDRLTTSAIRKHGLDGSALQFKFEGMARFERALRAPGGELTYGQGLTKLLQAAGIALGSLLDATKMGTLVMEFYDMFLLLLPDPADG